MKIFISFLLGFAGASLPALVCAAGVSAAPYTLTSVFELGANTDAFSSIKCLGQGICLAGKRAWAKSSPYKGIYRSTDSGMTWQALDNPEGLTGAHVYFFGQNQSTVLVGTGDTGNVSLMRSTDLGATWSVVLSAEDVERLSNSQQIAAIFSPLSFGDGRWLVNLRNDQDDDGTNVYFLESLDDGVSWHAYSTPGLTASGRKVMQASDGTLVYSGFEGDNGIWISKDQGATWSLQQEANAFSGQADLGNGVYLVGTFDSGASPSSISIYKSTDYGQTWQIKKTVSVKSETAYFRSIVALAPDLVIAFASSSEFSESDRQARTYFSRDQGETWTDAGAPYRNQFGNMNAIYDAAVLDDGSFLLVAQPDSDILRGTFTDVRRRAGFSSSKW